MGHFVVNDERRKIVIHQSISLYVRLTMHYYEDATKCRTLLSVCKDSAKTGIRFAIRYHKFTNFSTTLICSSEMRCNGPLYLFSPISRLTDFTSALDVIYH